MHREQETSRKHRAVASTNVGSTLTFLYSKETCFYFESFAKDRALFSPQQHMFEKKKKLFKGIDHISFVAMWDWNINFKRVYDARRVLPSLMSIWFDHMPGFTLYQQGSGNTDQCTVWARMQHMVACGRANRSPVRGNPPLARQQRRIHANIMEAQYTNLIYFRHPTIPWSHPPKFIIRS